MHLIVGLGNPGKQYERTRHNVGFMVLDALQKKYTIEGFSTWETSKKFNAHISGGHINGEKILLAKPLTYMNNSGESVQLIGHFYKLTPNDILVVHDDKDIELGEIRIQKNRGDGGHNGIKSIIAHLGTKDFSRMRIGVASKNKRKMKDTAKFVLGGFGFFEKKDLELVIQESIQQIQQHLNQ